MAEDAASLIELPAPADSVSSDFNLDDLIASFRRGLPDPQKEANKPPQLANYRSETAEIMAREALSRVYDMATPPSLHATKGNRNQPILGFDGWTVMRLSNGALALVLIQVKATDDAARPPSEAAKLIDECTKAPLDLERLKGYLSACAVRCKGTTFAPSLIAMLVKLEREQCATNLVVAPVIVRGLVSAHLDDLTSIVAAKDSFSASTSRTLTISLGLSLNEFGRRAMDLARQA